MTPGARTHGRWVIVRTPDCRVAAAVGCAPDPIVRGRAHHLVLEVVFARGEAAVSGLWTPVDDGVAPSCWHAHRPIHRTQQPTTVVRLPRVCSWLCRSTHGYCCISVWCIPRVCGWVDVLVWLFACVLQCMRLLRAARPWFSSMKKRSKLLAIRARAQGTGYVHRVGPWCAARALTGVVWLHLCAGEPAYQHCHYLSPYRACRSPFYLASCRAMC